MTGSNVEGFSSWKEGSEGAELRLSCRTEKRKSSLVLSLAAQEPIEMLERDGGKKCLAARVVLFPVVLTKSLTSNT